MFFVAHFDYAVPFASYRFRYAESSIVWIPSSFTLENFGTALELMDYGSTLLMTGRIVLVTTLLTLISCSMAGYALARYQLKFSKLCMVVAILTIIVPMQTYIIPYFFQFRYFSFFGILNIAEAITGNSDVYLHLNDTEFTLLHSRYFGRWFAVRFVRDRLYAVL